MWFDPTTEKLAMTHSDVRQLRPNWSAGAVLKDEDILEQGFIAVTPVYPIYDSAIEKLEPGKVRLVDGQALMDYVIVPLTEQEIHDRNAVTVRRMTVLAFRNRFTAAEKAMIELHGTHNPASPFEQQLRSATIRAYLADVLAAKHIEPSRPETRGGVEVLEYWGLLAVGRAKEILDNPVLPSEMP